MKIVAELTKWNGQKVEQEIKRNWIDGIVSAVVGQYTFLDIASGFSIKGADFRHIDVYEIAEA